MTGCPSRMASVSGWALSAGKTGGLALVYDDWNYVLLYAGIGIGLSSLQDPTKTQNEISRRVWQDPRKGRWMLILLAAYALGAMGVGLVGAYLAADSVVNQLSLGLVAFGLGMNLPSQAWQQATAQAGAHQCITVVLFAAALR